MKLESYSDIIKFTKHQFHNYPVIEFDKFIAIKLGLFDRYITIDLVTKYRKHIYDVYNNTHECFLKFGTSSIINIKNLKFYQIEVGIDGPRHNDISSPVSVVSINDDLILLDGYHRLFKLILNEKSVVKCNILSLNV